MNVEFIARIAASPWIRWVAFLTCAAAFLYASFKPLPPEDIFANSDKVGHVLAFAALTLSGRYALDRIPGIWFWSGFAALSFILEGLQGALRPLRIFSLADGYANLIGVGVALVAYLLIRSGWAYLSDAD